MRRFLAILLIPFLLLGQMGGIAHSHADEPAGHDSRPHVHLMKGHGHDHGSAGHSHRSDGSHDGKSVQTAADDSMQGLPAVGEEANHDSDAIYGFGVSAPHRKGGGDESGTLTFVAALTLVPIPYLVGSDVLSVPDWLPPGANPGKCPLYLRIRCIRC